MSSNDLALRVEGLGKRYRLGETVGGFRDRALSEELLTRVRSAFRRRRPVADEIWALRDINFEVTSGERVGIVGRNGAGKSTLLKILSGVTSPTEGRAETWGRVGALLEVGTGFHPELTGRENVFLSGAILGMSRREVANKFDEIVDFAGVERFIDTPIKRYSTGMMLRLAFAIAAHVEPEILLVDEVLAVGDAEFQRKCLGRMAEISSHGRTVIFISHNLAAVARLCERVIVLEHGRVTVDGSPNEALASYLASGSHSAAECAWRSAGEAPGDDVVRLKAVRVTTAASGVAESVNTQEPVDVEVEYWQLVDCPAPGPVVALQFFNEDGVLLFHTANTTDAVWLEQHRERGIVTARCRIPGNLLAEGRLFVLVGLSTYVPFVQHALVPDVVSFDVVEGSGGPSTRGPARDPWPGVMRPYLGWAMDARGYDERGAISLDG